MHDQSSEQSDEQVDFMQTLNYVNTENCELWIIASDAPCRTSGLTRLLLAIVLN